MAFKPKVHECTVEDAGEEFTFYVQEPSGRQILKAAEESKKNPDKPAIENARGLFADYVVTPDEQAGAYRKLTPDEVDEFLDMRLTAMNKVSELVQEKIGLKAMAAKAKNA